ncbi:MAG: hypothetical protein CM15mP13_1690 [Pseudomonadota bacterium]|nr:MAG: hypothetical protein CM15mP13_1690 [Pseudomonadota bacterium]
MMVLIVTLKGWTRYGFYWCWRADAVDVMAGMQWELLPKLIGVKLSVN